MLSRVCKRPRTGGLPRPLPGGPTAASRTLALLLEAGEPRSRGTRASRGATGAPALAGVAGPAPHRCLDTLEWVTLCQACATRRGRWPDGCREPGRRRTGRRYGVALAMSPRAKPPTAQPSLARKIGAYGAGRTRSACAYTFIERPRRKPTSVIPARSASSTARLDGAEMAAIQGIRACRAF
jgi:hypothetical protein